MYSLNRYACFVIFCLFIVFILMCSPNHQSISSDLPNRIDTGARHLYLSSKALPLDQNQHYSPDTKYGWVKAPDSTFRRSELKKYRNTMLMDGVSGDELVFKADLSDGKWWLTGWIEAGKEDSSTLQILINGEEKFHDWQCFRPSAEPRESIQNMYRVFQNPFDVSDGQFTLTLHGNQDKVRLLGLTLIPDPVARTEAHRILFNQIISAGSYDSNDDLESLITQLKDGEKKNPKDAFYAYWLQQLQLLYQAEKLYHYRGWEWVTQKTGLSIFQRYHQAIMLLDGLLNRPEPETFPLYERALCLRAKFLYWMGKERGGRHEIENAQRDFLILRSLYPKEKLFAMYTGEKIEAFSKCDHLQSVENAPQWSILQYEALCRMREIAHWWVNERQAENGELGGKIGDDVELLRWWPSLIITGDPTVFKGWKKLADGVFQSPKVYKGYSKRPIDVEHASEYISDTAPMMVLYEDAPIYEKRLAYSAKYFQTFWTGYSEKGNRFFKSAWFGSKDILMDPPKNRDIEYNTRAMKAVRYLLWKTEEPQLKQTMLEYTRSWVKAAMGTEKGKPKGIIPASIRFPDEAINGDGKNWYEANMYWDYFEWEANVGSMMLDQILFMYKMTGDESLLAPFYATLELIELYSDLEGDPNQFVKGSLQWAVALIKQDRGFWNVISQWRLETGNDQYDSLILKYGNDYLKYRISGNEIYLIQGFETVLESVRYNYPLLTSEVLVTDRVYVRGADHLKGMLTGDGSNQSTSPYFAVTYEDTRETFTALVNEASDQCLKIDVFSFEDKEYLINLRLWKLKPGKYQMTMRVGEYQKKIPFVIKMKGHRLNINLPSHQLCLIEIQSV